MTDAKVSGGVAAASTLARAARPAFVIASALILANCSQSGTRSAGGIDPKYGVAASPKVVEDGDPVPKGGGRAHVGKPYTVAGKRYTPRENPNYVGEGIASWYGPAFHGRLTANGEVFDRRSIAAAHPTMPLPSYVRVTNLRNKRSMIVRVNDRGPFHGGRLIDLSERAAEALEFKQIGVARVKVEYMGRASTKGSDDQKLLATLTIDGRPASFPGTAATMVASNEPIREPAPVQAAPQRPLRRGEPLPILSAAVTARPAAPSLSPIAPSGAPRTTLAYAGTDAPLVAPAAPLPAEGAFDLITIPHAGVPTARAVPAFAEGRSQVAGLFYAPAETPTARFARRAPFAGLVPAR